MNTSSPLFPIPKIWIPAVAAIVAILISGIATGEFGTAEIAALITTAGYFVLGYSLPGGRDSGGAREVPARDREPVHY
jgi:hypothetical protein